MISFSILFCNIPQRCTMHMLSSSCRSHGAAHDIWRRTVDIYGARAKFSACERGQGAYIPARTTGGRGPVNLAGVRHGSAGTRQLLRLQSILHNHIANCFIVYNTLYIYSLSSAHHPRTPPGRASRLEHSTQPSGGLSLARTLVGKRPPYQKETNGLVRAPRAAFVWPCVFALAPPAATSARRPLGVQ